MEDQESVDRHAEYMADNGQAERRHRVRRKVADVHAGCVIISWPAVKRRRVPPRELVKVHQRRNAEIEERPKSLRISTHDDVLIQESPGKKPVVQRHADAVRPDETSEGGRPEQNSEAFKTPTGGRRAVGASAAPIVGACYY